MSSLSGVGSTDHFSLHHLFSIPYIHPMFGFCIEATALKVEDRNMNVGNLRFYDVVHIRDSHLEGCISVHNIHYGIITCPVQISKSTCVFAAGFR